MSLFDASLDRISSSSFAWKFFLHVSRDEQKKRFMERLDTPEKSWKFSLADIQERDYWDDYMHAFEEAIQATDAEET
jgi:polyphosphate kinase 2 (PPK2 family)